jgi:glutaredoxin
MQSAKDMRQYMNMEQNTKTAFVYRMVMPGHVCPFGQKSVYLLKKHGYTIEDNHLKTREETDAIKEKFGVKTTPQTFINGERIGGHDDLRRYFGEKVLGPDDTTYRPVVALFAVAALLAVAIGFVTSWENGYLFTVPHFIAIAMVLLALQKLQDVESFSTMFLNYDVLARKWVPYGYIYPYAEFAAGILMLAGVLTIISVPIALFIGGVGAWSVFKAVYLEKRELKCACVGGNSNVPLGFVSLTENLMMVAMAIWMGALFLL